MTLTIKKEHYGIYPKLREHKLQYINSALHPSYQCWVVLVMSPDGEFHSVKREHLKAITKLEVALT